MDLMRSLPLGLYLEQPVTWLHHLDARVKLAWLLTFLMTPVLANDAWRILLVLLLIGLTLAAWIPLRVWRQQLGWLLLLAGLVFIITIFSPDGLGISHQPRLPQLTIAIETVPTPEQMQVFLNTTEPDPALLRSPLIPLPTRYQYILFQQGPLTLSQRSLELGIRVGTLLFTLIYSTNLFLLTTAPEEITAGLERLLHPLRRWIPVTEMILTLTLALRFIPLVLEEVQNLVRAVRTRAINWKNLGFRGAAQIWIMLAERVLGNLLLRAEQIASAMQVRGFTSPNDHEVRWHRLRLRSGDWLAIASLLGLLSCRVIWGAAA